MAGPFDGAREESEPQRAPEGRPKSEVIARAEQRLSVGPQRDPEIGALLRQTLTVW